MKAFCVFSFDSCVNASTSMKFFPMSSFSENPVISNPFLLTNVILPVLSSQIIASEEVSIIVLSFCSFSSNTRLCASSSNAFEICWARFFTDGMKCSARSVEDMVRAPMIFPCSFNGVTMLFSFSSKSMIFDSK